MFYQGQHILFRPKNLVWTQEDSQRLKEFEVDQLFIECQDSSEHYLFLENNLSKILDEEDIAREQKTQIIFDTSQALISEIFDRPSSPENVRRSVSFVKNSVEFLKEKDNFMDLMKMASTDFSEYTHSLQVSAYAIALAQEVGLKNFNDLSAIGVGSILHDIGKTKIDRKILDKPGDLNEDERRVVEKHPEYGYEILQKQRTVPEAAEMIVLQHHERPHGHGYPYRLGGEILQAAKIVAVADCFDSLTSDRPFKKRLKPLEALKYMTTELKDEYDQSLIVPFIQVLGVKT